MIKREAVVNVAVDLRLDDLRPHRPALVDLLQMPGGIRPGNLRFSPYWDPLRKDARFETLLKNPPPVSY